MENDRIEDLIIYTTTLTVPMTPEIADAIQNGFPNCGDTQISVLFVEDNEVCLDLFYHFSTSVDQREEERTMGFDVIGELEGLGIDCSQI